MKRLVVVGAGLVGKRHVEAIRHLRDVALIAIVDPHKDGQTFAKQCGVSTYKSLDDMFQHEVPDGVVLSTPTPLHVEQALECVAHDCPVLVEKPIATTANEASGLVEVANTQKVPLLIGHHRRHNPIIQKAYEMIQNKEIGKVRAVHVHCWFYKPDHYFDVAPWRKKKGAGPISVNLVHDADLISYLCGEVESVQAQAAKSQRGYENEDVAAAVLRFSNGVIGTITVSDSIASPWSWELTSSEYPIYPATSESCYMIGGSEGSLSIPDLTLWRHEKKPDWWSPIMTTRKPRTTSDPLINQMRHFVDVIEGKVDPLVSGLEAVQALRVIESIQRSARSEKTVLLKKDRASD